MSEGNGSIEIHPVALQDANRVSNSAFRVSRIRLDFHASPGVLRLFLYHESPTHQDGAFEFVLTFPAAAQFSRLLRRALKKHLRG